MRRLLTSVLIASLGACASIRAGTPNEQVVRVMTWNIESGRGDIAQTAEEIRKDNPDIVALQEVDVHWAERSSFVDQADSLARSLHMQVRFAPIYHLVDSIGGRTPREFGVAVLSRYPITAWKNHEITRHSTQQVTAQPSPSPGFLEVTVDAKGTKLRIFDTHLDYRADPAVRQVQVADMLAVIERDQVPTLLFGDLNANPSAPEIQPLLARMHDAWPPSSGSGLTYPAGVPAKRIDYVLISSGIGVKTAKVPVTEASDHRPVVVDLVLQRR